MENVFDILMERGYIEQCTHENEIREMLGKEKITFYTGFDPTADSLHIGHFIPIMAMAHMQKAGHRPIALLGGGTTMVGDPSGKTDMRKMLTSKQIDHNATAFKRIFEKFLDFSDDKALMVNNADWLLDLNYIEFLREIGSCFSVNKMLTAEAYKQRMEKGLTFLEFNYMIMQSYDFLRLYDMYNCKMQLGGNDQWSNIISGVDLVRRKKQENVYGMTFKLLVNSEGNKMGKTVKGALWLDPKKTSPYEFYQYWRNIDDLDVEKCLALLTFLPMSEVKRLGYLRGSKINESKEVLAYEVTKLIHGEKAAEESMKTAREVFKGSGSDENMPSTEISNSEFGNGMDIISLMQKSDLISSKSEGRRLIKQGGVSVNNEKVTDISQIFTKDNFKEGNMIIKKGKKIFHKIKLI